MEQNLLRFFLSVFLTKSSLFIQGKRILFMSPLSSVRRIKPVIPKARRVKFKEFKSSLLSTQNGAGEFLLLPQRKNMVWAIDPTNWRSKPRHIKIEHFGGHKGARRHESFQVKVTKPGTNFSRTLIFKPSQIPNQRFQELYGLESFR